MGTGGGAAALRDGMASGGAGGAVGGRHAGRSRDSRLRRRAIGLRDTRTTMRAHEGDGRGDEARQ